MPYAANLPLPATAATGDFATAGLVSTAAPAAATEGLGRAEAPFSASVATAAQAVETVLDAAQVAADVRRSAVDLKFTVAGAELQVRVTLRDDEVQATFHTESPDLRRALAQEWDSVVVAAGAAERGVRLLPAIFSSSSANPDSGAGSGFTFAGGDQSAAQREGHARRGDSSRPGSAPGRSIASAPPAGPAASVPRASLPTSRHLHTLA